VNLSWCPICSCLISFLFLILPWSSCSIHLGSDKLVSEPFDSRQKKFPPSLNPLVSPLQEPNSLGSCLSWCGLVVSAYPCKTPSAHPIRARLPLFPYQISSEIDFNKGCKTCSCIKFRELNSIWICGGDGVNHS